ncbi:MAG: hypothetical protein ACREH6_01160 [Geminicoccaceae bacterium]
MSVVRFRPWAPFFRRARADVEAELGLRRIAFLETGDRMRTEITESLGDTGRA